MDTPQPIFDNTETHWTIEKFFEGEFHRSNNGFDTLKEAKFVQGRVFAEGESRIVRVETYTAEFLEE